ncbi:ATP-binding protein [Geobacter benzoatilyticus]|uniref:histidine kinase n=1 Tax=Geobacter benzoatilyticus TaxID=2815309 RepID=A0ABX7Q365_9BACT|nr:HAMP domain-containing sensor histidine kinase [Geobacter benzoatilyticus]QSV45475.1 HAMP domain-containing histidine kinase [Geobacter benzoatilyticus]
MGRLSAMRLGSRLQVQSATAQDSHINILDIDWEAFSQDPEMMAEDVDVEPYIGPAKTDPEYHGTKLFISGLQGNWSPARIRDVAQTQFAKLSDPFSRSKRRYRVAITFNSDRIEIPRIEEVLFEHAHAICKGKYIVKQGTPRLEIYLRYENEEKQIISELPDIRSLTKDFYSDVARSALTTVGPFNFELYWFNRKRFNEIDTTGLRNQIRDWQKLWAGIMLFRDNYRVFPYGEESDDWLGLDRRALAASGYKLNKAQFVGRVAISRLKNQYLIDQTNREGLKDCDEKAVLIAIMKYTIQTELKSFMEDVDSAKRTEAQDLDFSLAKKKVDLLENRAKKSISELQKRHKGDAASFTELNDIFQEMQHYFVLAKERAEQIEDERLRMIQLAGVGLMIEVVAHELARATEHTLTLLNSAESDKLSNEVESLFGSLRHQMKTINKRLRVLDPLSVSGRQRKETFDFVALLKESLDSRSAQFERHGIGLSISIDEGQSKKVYVNAVRGMMVQIIENLLANSVYWLKIEREDNIEFKPKIAISLTSDPFVLKFTDNGPGVRPERKEIIFRAFYSTKAATTRQGLGLFIARDCANYHNGKLYLSSEPTFHRDRLNTFILELPKEILK